MKAKFANPRTSFSALEALKAQSRTRPGEHPRGQPELPVSALVAGAIDDATLLALLLMRLPRDAFTESDRHSLRDIAEVLAVLGGQSGGH